MRTSRLALAAAGAIVVATAAVVAVVAVAPGAADGRNSSSPGLWQLYNQALRTVDKAKRKQIVREMYKIEYDTGGYIVWGFYNLVDAYSPKVAGFKPSKGTLPLGGYGNSFRSIWFK